jgi:hypothetical protein
MSGKAESMSQKLATSSTGPKGQSAEMQSMPAIAKHAVGGEQSHGASRSLQNTAAGVRSSQRSPQGPHLAPIWCAARQLAKPHEQPPQEPDPKRVPGRGGWW